MLEPTSLSKTRLGRIVWIVAPSVLVLILLSVSLTTNRAVASSPGLTSPDGVLAPALQSTATPTPTLLSELSLASTSNYSFSLATLGYDETKLISPLGNAEYVFRLPENWLIQTDGMLELDLSYVYNQNQAGDAPTQFGNLTVLLDNQTLEIFPIEARELDHYLLQIPLPSALLASDRNQHTISLQLEAESLCWVLHEATLIIHPTSSIFLNYSQRSIMPDLARYPRPFYQRAFTPDNVLFVLPARLTTNYMTDATGIAARLGNLTGNQLAITATIDMDFSRLLASSPMTNEHFIVIGTPQDNQLVPLLNDVTELPVSLHRQQLELISQGPRMVAPGDSFTYAFTITNIITRMVNLSLVSMLPAYTELITCTADCASNSDDATITWNDIRLAPNETINLMLTLKATDTLTGPNLENTITLIETTLGPVNTDTLTSVITSNSTDSQPIISTVDESGYFFTYNGQAVARGDGIVQEILSPWNESRAILIVTGLSDEAVRKASQAMSSEARLPGMRGPVALVRDVLPLSTDEQVVPRVEATFEELGYSDQILRGADFPQVDYLLDIPYGWRLTDEAFVDLYFTHSQLINYESSGLTVLLNNSPLASIALNEETAADGYVRVSLVNAALVLDRPNRLGVRVSMLPSSGSSCADSDTEQAWLRIKNNSKIFLAHTEQPEAGLDLSSFPHPFNTNQTLSDLLFALPSMPTVNEWEAVLRFAANLGSSTRGKMIVPAAIVGDALPKEDLANYHIIAIGRPSRNPLMQQVNLQLPQPFLPDSDEIEQRLENIIFRLPPGIDLGYLQLIPSPWNEARAFLAVTGTTDKSVQEAVNTLLRRSGLGGNLAFIRDIQVNTIDTRELMTSGVAAAIATVVPEMTPIAVPTATATLASSPDPTSTSSASEQTLVRMSRPTWLIPLVGLNGLFVMGIFAFVFWRAHRKRL